MKALTKCLSLTGFMLTLLVGCGGEPETTDELCAANPGLCDSYNLNDGQCRIQRTNTIWQEYETRKTNTDANKFKLLQNFIDYRHCLGLANQIELTKMKERGVKRSIAYTFSTAKIEQLEKELKHSQDPNALYYFWSQYNDKNAEKAFLALEGTKALETPQLQFSLAGYYSTRDKDKSIIILTHALALYNDDSHINPDILKSLISLTYQQNYYELSYIWTLVANDQEIISSSEENLQQMFNFPATKREELEEIADTTASQLRRGTFRSKNMPLPKSK